MLKVLEISSSCTTEILSDETYLAMLDVKFDEELAEYHRDQSLEELDDLLEAICAAVLAHRYTLEQLEAMRAEKTENEADSKRRFFERSYKDCGGKPCPNKDQFPKVLPRFVY